MYSLSNRVAIITGGAQGIGKAIVLAFAQAGAHLIVADVDSERIDQTVKEVEATGRKAAGVVCNIADGKAVSELVEKTLAIFPTIDILVNNAGITRDGLMMRMSEEDWDLVLSINLKGPFLATKAVSPVMMRQRYGRIVNIASVTGLMGNAGQANYSSSKGGLVALTKTTARELASRNITCNAIAPGFIATPMTDKLPDKVKEQYMKAIPLNRFGTAADVASAVLFFASEESGYITGQVLGVDGGMFMR